ncbi:DNA topoisomerase [Kiloniella sp. b19]|uniref:DNA topoisomerase n=1 Tax=Kiloniella sp. GXU_MW_B19 TaxID=3141326 RepID=UPI0031E262D2
MKSPDQALKTIVITEKTSQKKDVMAAIGSSYGQVYAAEGHLLSLQEPQAVNKGWGKWGYDLLKPEDFYPTCPVPDASPSAINKLQAIEGGLKTAERVIIATDCDREGQLIGEELLRHFRYGGLVQRAMFTAQDEKTIREAFDRLEDNGTYFNLGQAAMARQQADQVYNLSLTRAATVALKQPGQYGAIGIGRVKTPTLALVCIREEEITSFTPQDYYHLVATAQTEVGAVTLRHAPKERILEQERAEALAAQVRGFEGPIKAEKKTKKTKPPKLLDLPELQKICSRRWGWTADKTLSVAQELYDGDGKKIQTYPRAESRYLAENQIADVPEIIAGLIQLPQFSALDLANPEIRKGKSGHFSDEGLKGVSHHAIIPNKNTMDRLPMIYPRLSEDERKMFDLVAASYLAILMPDYVYESTTLSMDVKIESQKEPLEFKITGNIPKIMGWKEVYSESTEKKGEDETEGELPPVNNGTVGKLDPVELDAKKTKAPPRFNEGTLIDAMQNAWRFIDDRDQQERLKEAKGIGTPATRASIITGLKRQNFIAQSGKHIVPTDPGMTLFRTLKQAAPELVDPGVTALWEMKLDDILLGHQTARSVWDEIGDETLRLIGILRERSATAPKIETGVAAPRGGKEGGKVSKPTDKMKETAFSIAARKGLRLPKGLNTNFDTCRDFLDEHLSKNSEGPSVAALERKVASGWLPGISAKQAGAFVESFGPEVLNFWKAPDEELEEKLKFLKGEDGKGLGAKKIKNLLEWCADQKKLEALRQKLGTLGLPVRYAERLEVLLDEGELEASPYAMILKAAGPGFEEADRLWSRSEQGQGIPLSEAVPRAEAALVHALRHMDGPQAEEKLFALLERRLALSTGALKAALEQGCEKGWLVQTKAGVDLKSRQDEQSRVKKAVRRLEKGAPSDFPSLDLGKAVPWLEKQLETKLSEQENRSLSALLEGGGTALSRAACHRGSRSELVLMAGMKLLAAKKYKLRHLAAGDGEASRLSKGYDEEVESFLEALGRNSKGDGFRFGSRKPFENCDCAVIWYPEASGKALLAALLEAVPTDARVLLAGKGPEGFELTPVAGFPVVAEQSSLKDQAVALLEKGESLESLPAPGEGDNFFVMPVRSAQDGFPKLVEIVKNRLPARLKALAGGKGAVDVLRDIRIVSDLPRKNLPALNRALQEALTPERETAFRDVHGWRFRIGDPLLVQEDWTELMLAAGDLGWVRDIDHEAERLTIAFGSKSRTVPFALCDLLVPAFVLPLEQTAQACRAAVVLSSGPETDGDAVAVLEAARDMAVLVRGFSLV